MNRVSAKTSFAHLEFMQWSLRKYGTLATNRHRRYSECVVAGSRTAFLLTLTCCLLQSKDSNNDKCFKRGIMTPSDILNTHKFVSLDRREWVMQCHILFL
jgi:hypothetical protein